MTLIESPSRAPGLPEPAPRLGYADLICTNMPDHGVVSLAVLREALNAAYAAGRSDPDGAFVQRQLRARGLIR